MRHHTTPDFWACYRELPPDVQLLADKSFAHLSDNPRHPSLHFKKVGRFWSARIGLANRVVHSKGRVGDVVTATVPTHVSSIIEFASGPTATLVTSFDVKASRYRNIEIYGSEATLSVPDPNTFGGPVQLRSIIAADWRELPLKKSGVPQQRGVGLADMLSATKHGRPHRASGEMALHVLEMMTAIVRSSDEGRRIEMTSTCGRPAPLRSGLALNAFD